MRRFIRPNHSNRIPRHHVCVDTETVPVPHPADPRKSIHKLRLGTATYFRFESGQPTRRDDLEFMDRNTFWNWLLGIAHKKASLWVWMHNAGFDLGSLRLWELLEIGELSLSRLHKSKHATQVLSESDVTPGGILVDSDPPTIIKCYDREGRSVIFLDLMNWCPTSLKDIGESLGCDKREMPGELASDQDWADYCRRDTEILQRAVLSILSFVQENDLGNLRWTVAAQSMALWRHRAMDAAVCTDGKDTVKDLERKAYYGGRCEVYYAGAVQLPGIAGLDAMAGVPDGQPRIHAGPVYHLDVVGAYPAAMLDNVYPVRYLCTERDVKPVDVLARMGAQCCAAAVRIDCHGEPWPVRKGDETWWMVGSYDTVLCGPELERALKWGDVKHVYECQWYCADRPFVSFVRAAWALREHYRTIGNDFLSRLSKMLANSLHGKFAQRSHRWSLLPGLLAPRMWGHFPITNAQTKETRWYRSVAGHVQRREKIVEKDDNFPLIAAYCTAYHREHMRCLKSAAGHRQVLYEDADSLHVTQAGKESLDQKGYIANGEIGKLRIEAVCDKAIYYGPKHYVFGDKVVNCGLHRKSAPDPRGLWHHTNFVKLEQTLNDWPHDGPVSFDEEIETPFHPIRGRVAKDGWVYPLRANDAANRIKQV